MFLFLFNTIASYLFCFFAVLIFQWFRTMEAGLVWETAFVYSLFFLSPIVIINYFDFRTRKKKIERPVKYLLKKFAFLVLFYILLPVIIAAITDRILVGGREFGGLITIIALLIGGAILVFSLAIFGVIVLARFLKGWKTLLPVCFLFTVALLFFLWTYFNSPGYCPPRDANCIAIEAIKNNDSSLCERSKFISSCYYFMAVKTNDGRYCDMTRKEDFHSYQCYEYFNH